MSKLKVFVSSTWADLQPEREAIAAALRRVQEVSFIGMESFGSRSEAPKETCLAEVANCDIYLGIFAFRYGSIDPETDKSMTELEYRKARDLNKPCLIYLKSENALVRAGDFEQSSEAQQKLKTLKEELQHNHIISYFVSADELRVRVIHDLLRLIPKITPHRPPLVHSELEQFAQWLRDWLVVTKYQICDFNTVGDRHIDITAEQKVKVGARHVIQRVLVRCLEGEIGVADVNEASVILNVNDELTEAWLVSIRRVAQAARAEVTRHDNIGVYTFDELIDESADFSKYFNWLETKVKRYGIDTKYVDLSCTKDDFDPATKQKVGTSHYEVIDQYIDLWLDDPAKEHISILGKFGTGKTWFCLHYAYRALKKYMEAKERGVQRPRLPIVIPLRDYAKAVSVESLFSEFFFRKYEIGLPGYSAFEQLNRMGKLLLVFDGFDEMASKVDYQKVVNNFWELAKTVVPGAKAILTCRTEHFRYAQEGRDVLGAEARAATSNIILVPPRFEVLELQPLNEKQIQDILVKQAPNETEVVQRIMNNPRLHDLARRPVLIEFILEALPQLTGAGFVDTAHVYLYACQKKMESDITQERTFTSLADKLYFLCELSWEMLTTNTMTLNYKLFPERIRRFFGEKVQEKDLDHWWFDLMGQTLLIRDADGNYTPAHRSLLEFFAAYKFAAVLGILPSDFVTLAQKQRDVDPSKPAIDQRWSEYFRASGKALCPLANFPPETTDYLKVAVEKYTLPEGVLRFVAEIVSNDANAMERLGTWAWEGTGTLSWNTTRVFPFLKSLNPERAATGLLQASQGKSLKGVVAWVLGELGVTSNEVVRLLEQAANSPNDSDPWWHSTFALHKLTQIHNPVDHLVARLPAEWNLSKAVEQIKFAVAAHHGRERRIEEKAVIALVKAQRNGEITKREIEELLEPLDFAHDTERGRIYNAIWLLGELRIKTSLSKILLARNHPQASVRNCLSEAIGKMGAEVLSEEVVEVLTHLLQSDFYYRTRLNCARSLGLLGVVSAIPDLKEALHKEEVNDVRIELEWAIKELKKRGLETKKNSDLAHKSWPCLITVCLATSLQFLSLGLFDKPYPTAEAIQLMK
jgi:hypothetical protein